MNDRYAGLRSSSVLLRVVTVAAALLGTEVAFAHTSLPPYIAFWGPFSSSAARCQRQLGTSAGRCVQTVLAHRIDCDAATQHDCGTAAQHDVRDAAIAAAQASIGKACAQADVRELLFRDLAEANEDVSLVCAGESQRLHAMLAPGVGLPEACAKSLVQAQHRLLRLGLREKRSALNRIAMHAMTPSQRLRRINLAQQRMARLRQLLVQRLQSQCPELAGAGVNAAAWLAQVELRVECIVFAGYIQSAFRCQ